MKKIVLGLIGCLLVVGLATGCGNNKSSRNENPYLLQTESNVYDYLKENYPKEQFEILKWEYQNKYTNARNWYIKSLTTNLEFKIYDEYTCPSFDTMGHCEEEYIYSVFDNYNIVKSQQVK